MRSTRNKNINYQMVENQYEDEFNEMEDDDEQFFQQRDERLVNERAEALKKFQSSDNSQSSETIEIQNKGRLEKHETQSFSSFDDYQKQMDNMLKLSGGTQNYTAVFNNITQQKIKRKNKLKPHDTPKTFVFPIQVTAKKINSGFDVMVSPLESVGENQYKKDPSYDYDTIGNMMDQLTKHEQTKGQYNNFDQDKMTGKINKNLMRAFNGEPLSSKLSPYAVKTITDFASLQRLEVSRTKGNKAGGGHVFTQMGRNRPFTERYNKHDGTMVGSQTGGAKNLRDYK